MKNNSARILVSTSEWKSVYKSEFFRVYVTQEKSLFFINFKRTLCNYVCVSDFLLCAKRVVVVKRDEN